MNYETVIEPKYRNIVLSSGSVRAISHVGALQKLLDEKLIDLSKIECVAGTSAGSLIGLLIVLGFTISEIWNFLLSLDLSSIIDPDFLLFFDKCGFDSGKKIYNLVEQILVRKTNIKCINFKQLYELTNIHFTVVGTCLTTKQAVYYDHINTPDFKVSLAVRISISIPIFFTPVTIKNNKYIDGGLLNNYPIKLFTDKIENTIGILIYDECSTTYDNPAEYIASLVKLLMHHHNDETFNSHPENTIVITKTAKDANMLSFDIDDNTKKNLYDIGVEAATQFINQYVIN